MIALLQGLLIVAQADLLARVLTGSSLLLALTGVVAARALLAWAQGFLARRAAARRKEELRRDLLRRRPEVTLIGRGLDALDPYIAGYLPQRYAAAIVPVVVLARLVWADWGSALIIAVTLPLIPVFGALIGWKTREVTERQWGQLRRLGGHFLDVVTGLPTLRAYGRDGVQTTVIESMADGHRRTTMRALRIAFLSSLALDTVATLSVSLVAVPAGLRLLAGTLDLRTALLILLLAPEAYLPLRLLGTRFHAAAEGKAVLTQVDEALSAEPPTAPRPLHGSSVIQAENVVVRFGEVAALDGVSLSVAAGERVALVGPSGAGKSTLLAALLGLVTPEAGEARVAGTVAYVPQRPHLFAGTVADNIRLGRPDASDDEVRAAAEVAMAHGFIADLPGGYATELGERGLGLSTGQRQRIAIARAYLLDAPIVIMDEPTARLDLASEAAVAQAAARLLTGRTALLVAHRPALLTLATRTVHLAAGRIPQELPA